ncbi:hypothetical protein [Mesorhizobium sp. B2-1-2]|uniref:hypothetical protein n=1 Tax=Mesorhizobium sp. B2-1-2 TaxID=2589973 RepID=UPI00112EBCAA|nr:hypothetical protein [Mesorhizobium sp. B2-1-2]TPN11670.1 hypothetical protein FJ971_09690 [Mesorhizobium sp. B2-1-2]
MTRVGETLDQKALADAPAAALMHDTGEPEWKQINALFLSNGINTFPISLRDELSIMLAWARYGERVADLFLSDDQPLPDTEEKGL